MSSGNHFIRFARSGRQLNVGKIICLGRNYAKHAKEMKAAIPQTPVLFLKPSTALIHSGESVRLPPFSNEIHHEAEMVIAIGRQGKIIPEASAREYIAGYGVGLDMTLRDVQSKAKKEGLPWSVAKGFDTSAPVSDFLESDNVPEPDNLDIRLWVNGSLRQSSNTGRMLTGINGMVAYASSIFTLEPGDLIFTGTPEGVAAVSVGDILKAELAGVATLEVTVAQ